MTGWDSTADELAREAQGTHGWSDAELVERGLAVLRRNSFDPGFERSLADAESELAALGPDASDGDRAVVVIRFLPAFYGPGASYSLGQGLVEAGEPSALERPPASSRSPLTPASARAWWRRPWVIVLGTWLVLVVVSVLWVLVC
ncbi:hypothetical protein [Nocardioides acrostichi]|uniref:Uncharacterized protein n=1 Tax=Nocardioides acrostichi TaxID=2784339 RepID=A0A930UUF4_9ACTN|nr:hypothetical protein [Nocardioides acrostichi]MBF4161043.1 hypothetical protein [Nocardioides acrostichi]